jgi:transposase
MSVRVGVAEEHKAAAILEMKAAMKLNKDLRMHERYQTILMLLLGESYERISEVTGRTLATLYNYSKAYREQGIQGLQIGRPPGRNRLLTAEQEQQVYEVVTNQTPADQGFPAQMNWTSPLIRKWIEQKWEVRYSDRGTRDLLYRLKLSFTKPTYTLAKADPQKQEEFKEHFQALKKTPRWGHRPDSVSR